MKRNDPDTACFGNPDRNSKRCIKCEYRQSCSYCAATESSVDSRSKLTCYEEIQSWLPECADFDHIPGEFEEDPPATDLIPMLSRFFRFLLELDDYTVGIISEIIAPKERSVKRCTISYLGKMHGCSRQAMHRKILDIIARRPELTTLLQSTMYKLSSGRQRFMRSRSKQAVAGN